MKILEKSEKTIGKKQYHIHLSPGDIGEYVLLPGDPARSDIVAKYLDDAKLVGHNREHKSYTGYYKGVKVTVTSTGMGCPSAAIAAEELINIGAKCLIRIKRKVRGAMICAISGNLVEDNVIYETTNYDLIEGWEREIQVVLESIYNFDKRENIK